MYAFGDLFARHDSLFSRAVTSELKKYNGNVTYVEYVPRTHRQHISFSLWCGIYVHCSCATGAWKKKFFRQTHTGASQRGHNFRKTFFRQSVRQIIWFLENTAYSLFSPIRLIHECAVAWIWTHFVTHFGRLLLIFIFYGIPFRHVTESSDKEFSVSLSHSPCGPRVSLSGEYFYLATKCDINATKLCATPKANDLLRSTFYCVSRIMSCKAL